MCSNQVLECANLEAIDALRSHLCDDGGDQGGARISFWAAAFFREEVTFCDHPARGHDEGSIPYILEGSISRGTS